MLSPTSVLRLIPGLLKPGFGYPLDRPIREGSIVSSESGTECRICDVVAREHEFRADFDRPLIQSASFEVFPSLGSLVEGWLLVVPRAHRLSLAECSQRELEDLDSLRAVVAARLATMWHKPIVSFEHGPGRSGEPLGCGVDHAHLHVVPLAQGPFETARTIAPELVWAAFPAGIRGLADATAGSSYIYLEDEAGAWLSVGEDLPSQLLRRAIAHDLGRSDEWNWRDHPQNETVGHTIASLRDSELGSDELARAS